MDTSTQARIEQVAALYGWDKVTYPHLDSDIFSRGEQRIVVYFDKRGGIKRVLAGKQQISGKGKGVKVIELLSRGG